MSPDKTLRALRVSLIPTARLRDAHLKSKKKKDLSVVLGSRAVLTLPEASAGVHAAVRRLRRGGGAAVDAVWDTVYDREGVEGSSAWLYALRALERAGLVRYSVVSSGRGGRGGRAIARLTPTSPHYVAEFNPVAMRERVMLSRFAVARRAETRDGGRGWILESPLAMSRVELLHARAMLWLHELAAPTTLARLAHKAPLRERETQRAFVALLHGAGFLTSPTGASSSGEDRMPQLAQWELADALMHARSRRGRSDAAYGRVFPFRGRWRPLPSSKTMASSVVIPLTRPPLPRADPGFARVLESRRSYRAHGGRPINVRQLSEFLYRAARVQASLPREPRDRPYAATLRPSPSGGACHPLELYLVVNRCAGLARGMYHYDPVKHRLGRLATPASLVQLLLDDCPPPAYPSSAWQILIVLAARFRRVTWKYRAMSYATILKDVGALMQTMYLVATAMKLAPCALGGGDSERFARIIGSDFFDETSVGEFLLGSRPRPGIKEHVQ